MEAGCRLVALPIGLPLGHSTGIRQTSAVLCMVWPGVTAPPGLSQHGMQVGDHLPSQCRPPALQHCPPGGTDSCPRSPNRQRPCHEAAVGRFVFLIQRKPGPALISRSISWCWEGVEEAGSFYSPRVWQRARPCAERLGAAAPSSTSRETGGREPLPFTLGATGEDAPSQRQPERKKHPLLLGEL